MIYEELNVQIDNSTINALVNELLDEASRPTQELVQLSMKEIKQAAKNYLLILEQEKNNIKNLELALETQKKFVREQAKNFNSKVELKSSKTYIEQRERIKQEQKQQSTRESIINIYKASLAFQDLLNGFIGQEMIITYLASNKSKVGVYNIPLKEAFQQGLLNIDITSKTYEVSMRFNGSISKLEKLANDVDNVISKMEAGISVEEVGILDSTYKEVVRRFKTYKGKNKKGKEVGIILWHPNSKWFKMTPSSMGDINEAYVAYYLQAKQYPRMSGVIEKDIDIFMELVAEVDSAAGLMLGDISNEETGLEYAVKSAGASTLSLTQIENLAKEIINGKVTKKSLKDLKASDAQKGSLRNFIEELTKEEISETLKSTIDSINRDLK